MHWTVESDEPGRVSGRRMLPPTLGQGCSHNLLGNQRESESSIDRGFNHI